MKKIYSMKKVLLVVAALFVCNTLFAQQYSENSEGKHGGGKNIAAVGISYTIAGEYFAGAGSKQSGTMPSKGMKVRTATNEGKFIINVNNGYTIVGVKLDAVGNYNAVNADAPYITVSSVNVDGEPVTFEGGQFPDKSSSESGILTAEDFKAKNSVEITFDNSNAKSGETQLNMCWVITYEEAAADAPTIKLSPDTLHLITGASYQIKATVVPATFTEECIWYAGAIEDLMENEGISPDNDVVELGDNGLITAKGPGEIPVKLTWMGEPGVNEDTTVVIVSSFIPQEDKIIRNYDFTSMETDTLDTTTGDSHLIWNAANNQCNAVNLYPVREDLQGLVFQGVILKDTSVKNWNKGWQLINNDSKQGLLMTGGGRCAALTGLKAGQFVEFVYTGSIFETRDCTMDLKLGPDAGAPKNIINEEEGHAIYQMKEKDGEKENLMIGFEINTGDVIKRITVYDKFADPTAIQEVETAAEKSAAVYNLMGMKVAAGTKGLLIQNGKKVVVK